MHNYITHCVDTDAFTMCKPDMSEWTVDEIKEIQTILVDNFPEHIKWDKEPLIKTMVTVKTKNYILLLDDGKMKIKGSSLKKSTSETAIRELFNKFIDCLVYDKQHELVSIYTSYIKEAIDVKDISRWCSRKTITSKVLEGERTNETKVMDCIEGTDYREGDRIRTFYKSDDSLCLVENFNGDYNKMKLVKKIHTAIQTFDTILDMSQFINYSLKKNLELLEELYDE